MRFVHALFRHAARAHLCALVAFAHPAASRDAFPIEVNHALGTTRIEQPPERIVTLGWNGDDILLSLGRRPIGIARYGLFDEGVPPWNPELLQAPRPTLLDDSQLDFEAVAALKPDLILAVRTGMGRLQWQRLSRIAPTIAYRSGPWKADWREQTRLTGEALGEKAKAEALIGATETSLQQMATEHPELKGKTFIFGAVFRADKSLGIYFDGDPRVAALLELGLLMPESIKALARQNPAQRAVAVSFEAIDTLDADILIVWYQPGARAEAENDPLFRRFGPVQRGAYVPLDDPAAIWATSALSIRSIPYGMPAFLGQLAEAARHAEKTR
nr:iron-siderophore ABC transporter substrate-binding protein [uncultured Shinella sp.]